MCEAIRGMIEEGRLEGVELGRLEGLEQGRLEGIESLIKVCNDFGISKEETASKIVVHFSLPLETAKTYTDQYWQS